MQIPTWALSLRQEIRCLVIMIFERKKYKELLRWKQDSNGKTAMLVEGARRVGKSTLVEEFAKKEYRSYILIDFSREDDDVANLFRHMRNLDFFFMSLQTIFGVTLYPRESIIIFDEVQFQPLARQAIKHLVKDGRYDYIETGSLISIKRNTQNILIPSEEDCMTLCPMDFDEFLWATGKQDTALLLHQAFELKHPLGNAAHRQLMLELRLYMLVGGMPQAVDTYINTHNLQEVDETKRKILKLYDSDFYKIDSSGRISKLFNAIPSQLSKNAQRYQIGSVIANQTADRLSELVAELEDSKTITMAHHVSDPHVDFELTKDLFRYKMFIADTGLFITLAFHNKSFTDNIIYRQLLSDKLHVNLGYIYENLVAQMLVSAGYKLYYHTFPTENGNRFYETDFLLSRGNKIVPIEVKSSGYKTHKSLDAFSEKFSSRIAQRIMLYTKDYQKDGQTTCLPVYFTSLL